MNFITESIKNETDFFKYFLLKKTPFFNIINIFQMSKILKSMYFITM